MAAATAGIGKRNWSPHLCFTSESVTRTKHVHTRCPAPANHTHVRSLIGPSSKVRVGMPASHGYRCCHFQKEKKKVSNDNSSCFYLGRLLLTCLTVPLRRQHCICKCRDSKLSHRIDMPAHLMHTYIIQCCLCNKSFGSPSTSCEVCAADVFFHYNTFASCCV